MALVGPSGGGKSTIVKLIEHFYALSNGRITLGDTLAQYIVLNVAFSVQYKLAHSFKNTSLFLAE